MVSPACEVEVNQDGLRDDLRIVGLRSSLLKSPLMITTHVSRDAHQNLQPKPAAAQDPELRSMSGRAFNERRPGYLLGYFVACDTS